MKLAYCKGEAISLSQEILAMKKFNSIRIMKKLLATLAAIFTGMTIPATVLALSREALASPVSPFIGIAFYSSAVLILEIAKLLIVMIVIATMFKFISGKMDEKEFWYNIGFMMLTMFLGHVFWLMPIHIPTLVGTYFGM